MNLYLAHGGTNHGLWSGANHPLTGFEPTVTSYDYDAPVGEAGEITAKFEAFRAVIAAHTGVIPPPAPDPLPRQNPVVAAPVAWASLMEHLSLFDAPRTAPAPLSLEDLGADHGLVLYRGATVVPPDGRALILDGLADRAQVLLDGREAGTFDRVDGVPHLPMTPRTDGAPTQIAILVENQGRTNFGPRMGERKGLAGVRLNDRFIHGWESRALRIDQPGWLQQIQWEPAALAPGPRLARFTVTAEADADGFLALPGWGKGFIWLNGTLLGRYWERGPQVTLYAPAPLWRAGENEIVVLELLEPGTEIQLRDNPDLGSVTETAHLS